MIRPRYRRRDGAARKGRNAEEGRAASDPPDDNGPERGLLRHRRQYPWEQPGVFAKGTQRLLHAMKSNVVRRLVCVTGIGAGDSRGRGGFLYDRVFLPLLLNSVYADKDSQEALIRAADVDWTIVRPGFLTNGPLRRRYRVLTELAGVTAGRIARADVAHFILEELQANRYLRQTPLLTY
jgi:putative NADH-flavin reductase